MRTIYTSSTASSFVSVVYSPPGNHVLQTGLFFFDSCDHVIVQIKPRLHTCFMTGVILFIDIQQSKWIFSLSDNIQTRKRWLVWLELHPESLQTRCHRGLGPERSWAAEVLSFGARGDSCMALQVGTGHLTWTQQEERGDLNEGCPFRKMDLFRKTCADCWEAHKCIYLVCFLTCFFFAHFSFRSNATSSQEQIILLPLIGAPRAKKGLRSDGIWTSPEGSLAPAFCLS